MEDIDNGTEWTVGDRLRKARTTSGYKKKQDFADLLHITVKSLTRYEEDEVLPPWPYLESWATHTGRTVDWILEGDASLVSSSPTLSDRSRSLSPPPPHVPAEWEDALGNWPTPADRCESLDVCAVAGSAS